MHTIRRSIVYKCGWFEACDEIEEIFQFFVRGLVGTRERGTSVLPQRRRNAKTHTMGLVVVSRFFGGNSDATCMLYYWEVFGYVAVI